MPAGSDVQDLLGPDLVELILGNIVGCVVYLFNQVINMADGFGLKILDLFGRVFILLDF
jgi:hypothetical protein